ncbi:glycoside hydrolase family 3 protein [Microbacterium sp. JB110]|uniref:glycoside hydrolase family 3 protein n=1 Tax=Microbacterium sp. JB110 TaxID=2024477 RepID=UPI000B36256D|nr:glycoside hydrolase family 3 N-terminal domain-containing protein [Microbacterium sp. JB110]RCS61342.1 glycoside hydrolase family 3 protein [Microbacterium sp. JB110]
MRKSAVTSGLVLTTGLAVVLTSCASTDGGSYSTEEVTDGTTDIVVVTNPGDGKTLTMAKDSFELIEETDGGSTLAFKDMNGNGELDAWEDWRLDPEERAAALAPQLSADQVSGLMLFSSHERAPGDGLTDAQQEYLSDSYLRNVLYAGGNDIEPVVEWTNEMQAYVETLVSDDEPYIPVNFSSDPRNDAADSYAGASGGVSQWPSSLGMAATFDPDVVEQFGSVASAEYRAMGLANALSPQIDLATEPRWLRVNGTFGEEVDLASEMASAYVDGFQGTFDEDGENLGWGTDSVSTVIKHFPGDGVGEGGREAHTNAGKYGVLPGDNLDEHVAPFLAAIDAGGVMTSYSILLDGEGDPAYGNDMGSAYDSERVDILREENGYDGVIVTDWGVTAGGETDPDALIGTSWGADDLTVEERHFEVLKAGVDQFGGNNDIAPIQEAYTMWEAAHEAGDLGQSAEDRWADSGRRILTNLFRVGVYDSAYQDLAVSEEVVGNDDFKQAGLDAQHDSLVVLKNNDGTIADGTTAEDLEDLTVYIPRSFDTGHDGLFGPATYTEGESIDLETAEHYFGTVVTDEAELNDDEEVVSYTAPDLSDVDLVLVGMSNPNNGTNFDSAGLDQETGEFYPLSLQYRPYTADGDSVRKTSISGDTLEDGSKENRSYYGSTSRISNEADLDAFERAVDAVEASGEDIPVVTLLSISNGAVIPTEFEADSDAIVWGSGVSDAAFLDVALGLNEPTGRLPIALPKDMDSVEASLEDVADTTPYVDSEGNSYEFGFGLGADGQPIE